MNARYKKDFGHSLVEVIARQDFIQPRIRTSTKRDRM